MYDDTHAQELISEKITILDKDDLWVITVYRRHFKLSDEKPSPEVQIARECITKIIQDRCENLAAYYKRNNRPPKTLLERVNMIIEALEMPPFNGTS